MKWIAPILAYLAISLGMFVFQNAWSALLGFHLAILVSLWIAKPGIPVRILFTANDSRWTLLSVLLCAGSGITLYFFWDKFGISSDLAAHIKMMGLDESNQAAYITYFILANPWIEEYFWRGYLGSITRGLHGSDLLYSGFHGLVLLNQAPLGTIAFSLAVLAFAGWFWRQIARADQGLFAAVLGHMAADLTILLAVFSKM